MRMRSERVHMRFCVVAVGVPWGRGVFPAMPKGVSVHAMQVNNMAYELCGTCQAIGSQASDRPVLSTAVREAYEHEGRVGVGEDAEACLNLLDGWLGGWLGGSSRVDVAGRRDYISRQTWEDRACAMLEVVREHMGGEPC